MRNIEINIENRLFFKKDLLSREPVTWALGLATAQIE